MKFFYCVSIFFGMIALLFAEADSLIMDIFYQSKIIALILLILAVIFYKMGKQKSIAALKINRFYKGSALD